MNPTSKFREWLDERNVERVELIVPDMAGNARGKILLATQMQSKDIKLPIAVLAQSINGAFHMRKDNVEDKDMTLQPDVATLRLVPWATEPTASAIMDCYDMSGHLVEASPRAVLKGVVEKFAEKGWTPIVAPEVEFYLTKIPKSATGEEESGDAVEAQLNSLSDPYGIEGVHDLGDFFEQLLEHCRIQDIPLGAVSQELGPAQFEVNFQHGHAVKLADDVFHFKRTIRRVAIAHGMRVTFLAKPTLEGPGSSMHIHQSVLNDNNENIFSNTDGEPSELFESFLGGLQKYMPSALLLFAPYANSYRRFLSYHSSPVNLEWG